MLGLEPGVPGLSPSFCFRDGVERELELRLEGGLSLSILSGLLSPGRPLPLSRWSPFICPGRGPSSSPPTSTTRSPSDLSPESDSCPDFLRSESVFSLLAATSSLGVDDLIGLLAEIPGDLARGSLGSRPKLCESFLSDLLAGEAELLCLSLSSMAANPGFSSLISCPLCAMSCWMEVGGRPGRPG